MERRIYTIGHSTLPIEQFLALLRQHEIKTLVDIRQYPGSRRYPQFGQAALRNTLRVYGITYVHLVDLGGRRHEVVAGSGNEGWRVKAFRSYADYATYSPAFAAALERLEGIAGASRVALMCAEYTPLKCHRRILADLMKALDWDVQHITTVGALLPHTYTEHAHVVNGVVHYPAPVATLA